MNKLSNIFVLVLIGVVGHLLTPSLFAQGSGRAESIESDKHTHKNDQPSLLLVDDSVLPKISIKWISKGQEIVHRAQLPYTAPVGGDPLGENITAYVSLGGTRIETGAGHPEGAVIRLGITKADNNRAFFSGITPFTEIEMRIEGVKFNQPVQYHDGTAMMHLKYALGDLKACALPGTARNQYLLSDPEDTLGGRVIAGENATPGALNGEENQGVTQVWIHQDDPTMVSMSIKVPYGLLRHLQDPWKSELPGTFFEPIHLHAEAEIIPMSSKALDREPIVPESNDPVEESDTDHSSASLKEDQG